MASSDPNSTIAVDQPLATRDGNPRLVSISTRANANDFGAQVGQSLDSLGKGLNDFSDQLMEVSNKRDALYAQQVATKAEVDWRQNMAQAETAFTLDPSKGVDYASTYQKQFAAYQQNIIDNNPDITQNAKNQVMSRLNNVGASMFDDALRLQAKSSTDWSVQSFQNTAQNLDKLTNGEQAWVGYKADGSLDTSYFDGIRQQHTEMLSNASGLVPDGARREELLRFNTQTDKAEIDTVTNRFGAGVAAKGIQDGSLGTSLTIPQRQYQILELNRRQTEDTTEEGRKFFEMSKGYQLQVQATGQKDPNIQDQINAQAKIAFGSFGPAYAAKALRSASTDQDKFNAQQQLDTYLNQQQERLDGKYPTPESKKAFLNSLQDPNHVSTPEEMNDQFLINYMPSIKQNENPIDALDAVKQHQMQFQEQVQDAVKVSQGIGQIKSMSLDELNNTKEGLSVRDDNVSKSLNPIVSERIKAIQNDPFTVTTQDDKQMQSLLQQSSDMGQHKAALLSVAGDDTQNRSNEIYQQAVGRSLSLQQGMNPSSTGMVMSKADADFYVSNLSKAGSSTAISQTLQSMQDKFGPYFTQALNQLHNNPKNPLPAGMSVVAANINEPNAKDILTAISIPDGKGTGKQQEKEDNPGYTRMFEERGKAPDEKSIDTAIQGDSILNQYRSANAAVSNSKDSMDQVNGVIQATGKYAKFLYLNPPAGTTYTPEQAEAVASKSIIGKHVDFGNTNGVTYLINREASNGSYTDDETGKIKDQLDSELTSIAKNYPKDFASSGNSNPPDYTNQYNTKLNPQEEQKFKTWKQQYAPNDSGSDYDLRGAFKAGVTPNGERGHFPDTFKKPNHPTFSDESQYSTGKVKGGHWNDDNSFSASEQNVKTYGQSGLKSYFSRVEPNSKLSFPDSMTSLGELNTPGQKSSYYDISSKAYWVTTSDLAGVKLMMPPTDEEKTSREGIEVPNSFRSFSDMLNKAQNTAKPKATLPNLMPKLFAE